MPTITTPIEGHGTERGFFIPVVLAVVYKEATRFCSPNAHQCKWNSKAAVWNESTTAASSMGKETRHLPLRNNPNIAGLAMIYSALHRIQSKM
jgi:hypothetical protein